MTTLMNKKNISDEPTNRPTNGQREKRSRHLRTELSVSQLPKDTNRSWKTGARQKNRRKDQDQESYLAQMTGETKSRLKAD